MVKDIEEARTIWQSIDNLVGMEHSLRTFWAALVDELDVIGGDNLAFAEHEHHSSTSDADEPWVYTGDCRSYRLEARDGAHDRVLKGIVSVRIELWRKARSHSEPLWPYAKIPLVYVAFHRHPASDSDDVDYYGVDGKDFGLDEHGTPYHLGEAGSPYRARTPLWIWDGVPKEVDAWIESSWFFAVPLLAMTSYDGMREQIPEPLRRLLIENREPEDVFLATQAIPAAAVEDQ